MGSWRLAHIVLLACGLALVATALAAQTGTPTSVLPVLITTHGRDFYIPFQVDLNSPPPVEVQLHYSTDGGNTWQLYEKVDPQAGRFTFRAPSDGEYWFMVRTKSASGQLEPRKPASPELRVAVVTEAQRHAVTAEPGSQQAADTSVAEAPPYVAQHRQPPQPPNTTSAAQTFAHPHASDAAALTTMQPPPASQMQASAPLPSQAADTFPSVAQAWRPPASSEYDPRMSGGAPPSMPADFPGSYDNLHRGVPEPSHVAEERIGPGNPAPQVPLRGDPHGTRAPVRPSAFGPRLDGGGSSYGGSEEIGPPPAEHIGPPRVSADAPSEMIVPGEAIMPGPLQKDEMVGPGLSGNRAPQFDDLPDHGDAGLSGLPPGVQPRMVNSRRFELEYDVEAIGATGIVRVELWGSRDGGGAWSLLEIDEDSRSPIVVSVDREGLYGFRMVVETGNGLRTAPPEPGDLPELWVGVDLTAPDARLTSIDHGTGPQSGQLHFQWQANDALLAARPIALSFAESPSGPWSTIASGLPNSGSYYWRLDNRVPERIYVRLEARDEAGNLQTFVDPEPFSLEALRPKGRILGVRPVQ